MYVFGGLEMLAMLIVGGAGLVVGALIGSAVSWVYRLVGGEDEDDNIVKVCAVSCGIVAFLAALITMMRYGAG